MFLQNIAVCQLRPSTWKPIGKQGVFQARSKVDKQQYFAFTPLWFYFFSYARVRTSCPLIPEPSSVNKMFPDIVN